MAVSFKFVAHHPVQGTKLENLTVREASWTKTVNGGSVLTGKVTIPSDPNRVARIEQATRPDEAAIYVTSAPGVITWGGVVKKRTWDSKTNTITLSVQEWRTWLYSAILGPTPTGTGANTRTWASVDQLVIARAIIGYLMADGGVANGVPLITVGTEMSGILRTYGFTGTDFKSVGTLLDELGAMDNGFEWDIESYYGDSGNPTLRLATYYPQRGGTVVGLTFHDNFNIIDHDEVEMSSETRATRVWAVGEGPNAESLPYAVDNDPSLAGGYLLRTDAAYTFTGASRTVLASYARSQRTFLGLPLGQFTFAVKTSSPDFNTYNVGDRCRIILTDRLLAIDATNVRILSREIDVDAQQVKLTVNFNDAIAPEADPGGLV